MKRILLIENDFDLALSIKLGIDLIETLPLEKEIEYDGTSALERVKCPPAPDLLILDMHLPSVAGQDIYETVRQTLPGCKVIIITADIRLAKEIQEKEGDWQILPAPDALFTKPFSIIEFKETVEKLVAD